MLFRDTTLALLDVLLCDIVVYVLRVLDSDITVNSLFILSYRKLYEKKCVTGLEEAETSHFFSLFFLMLNNCQKVSYCGSLNV